MNSFPPIKKIVVIGPESTGKSSLCASLAQHYQTSWCPEFARAYLLKHGMDYQYNDLLTIAKGQLSLEDSSLSAWMNDNKGKTLPAGYRYLPFFIDTDMYVMKVWCEFVFGKCHSYVLDELVKRTYDMYLLCNTDLPWVRDELREYPNPEVRNKLFFIYKDCMINQPLPWSVISGSDTERVENAIAAIEPLLKG